MNRYQSMGRSSTKTLTSTEIIAFPLIWHLTADPLCPYQCEYKGLPLKIRLNSFPDREMYTLILGDEPIIDIDDWPTAWKRPSQFHEMLNIATGFVKEFYRRTFHRDAHGSAARHR